MYQRDPGNDMRAVMLALGAEFLVRASGERSTPARNYYRAAFTIPLADNEVLAALHTPVPLTQGQTLFAQGQSAGT
jgi:carbon-monoxide dehydrogenase medium subunit